MTVKTPLRVILSAVLLGAAPGGAGAGVVRLVRPGVVARPGAPLALPSAPSRLGTGAAAFAVDQRPGQPGPRLEVEPAEGVVGSPSAARSGSPAPEEAARQPGPAARAGRGKTAAGAQTGWVPVLIELSGDREAAMQALSERGFVAHAEEGAAALVGVMRSEALRAAAAAGLPGVKAMSDLSGVEPSDADGVRVQSAGASRSGGMGWAALMVEHSDIMREIGDLRAARRAADADYNRHLVHSIADAGNAVHGIQVARHRAQLRRIDAKLDAAKSRLAAHNESIQAHARGLASMGAGALAAAGWTPPVGVGDPGAKADTTPALPTGEVKGVPTLGWQRLHAKGFELSRRMGRVVITGRWTGQEIRLGDAGLKLSLDGDAVTFSKDGKDLSLEDAVRWLEVAEMAAVAGAPAEPSLSEEESAAAEAGRKLMAWGVPPHILNESQEVIQENRGGEKVEFSLSPDTVLYSVKQGVPLATKAGAVLAQILEKLKADRPDLAAALSGTEIANMMFLINQQVLPWWQYDAEQAPVLMDMIYDMLVKGRMGKPAADKPLGIDLAGEDPGLAAWLRAKLEGLQDRLTRALLDESALDEAHSLASAARFAWTQLSPFEEDGYRTVAQRDGLEFMKATGWERAEAVWKLMPTGVTFLELGLDKLVREMVEKGVRPEPVAIADGGWVDPFHPDTAGTTLIFRSGEVVDPAEFYNVGRRAGGRAGTRDEGRKGDKEKDEEERKKDAEKARRRAADPTTPKHLPLNRGAESSKIDSHATAIASLFLGVKTYSIDLPGFAGDTDVVPPGVNFDDFFVGELKRAMLSAMAQGVRVFNFSWGGGLGGEAMHKFFDEMAERGALIFAAIGNSGGFSGETSPSFSKSVRSIAATSSDEHSNFSTGGGFMRASDGTVVFVPRRGTRGGLILANTRTADRIPENPGASLLYYYGPAGDFIHIRGTSFASPLMAYTHSVLAGLVRHSVAQALGEEKAAAMRGAIDAAVDEALDRTAVMLPGVAPYIIGHGDARPLEARRLLETMIPELIRAAAPAA